MRKSFEAAIRIDELVVVVGTGPTIPDFEWSLNLSDGSIFVSGLYPLKPKEGGEV